MDINFVPLIFLHHKVSSSKKTCIKSMESSQKDAPRNDHNLPGTGHMHHTRGRQKSVGRPKNCVVIFSGQLIRAKGGGLSIGDGFIHVFLELFHPRKLGKISKFDLYNIL